MEKISRIALLAIAILLVGLSALALGRPVWTHKTPRSNDKVQLYVGIASMALDESAALKLATANAQERAILENFGATYKIDNTIEQSTKEVSARLRVGETTGEIKLNEFKMLESFTEKTKEGKYNTWVLFSIPKAVIVEEKSRLSDLQFQRRVRLAEIKYEKEKKQREKKQREKTVEVKEVSEIEGYSSEGKIRKGMSQAAVHKYFGHPDEAEVDSYYTTYTYKQKDFCKRGFFSYTYCTIQIQHGRVERFDDFEAAYIDLESAGGGARRKRKYVQKRVQASTQVLQKNGKPLKVSAWGEAKDNFYQNECKHRLKTEPWYRSQKYSAEDIENICICEVEVVAKNYSENQYHRNNEIVFYNKLSELNSCKANREKN